MTQVKIDVDRRLKLGDYVYDREDGRYYYIIGEVAGSKGHYVCVVIGGYFNESPRRLVVFLDGTPDLELHDTERFWDDFFEWDCADQKEFLFMLQVGLRD